MLEYHGKRTNAIHCLQLQQWSSENKRTVLKPTMRHSFDTDGDDDDYVNYVRLPWNRSDTDSRPAQISISKNQNNKTGNRLNDRRSIYVTVFENGILTFFFFMCFSR